MPSTRELGARGSRTVVWPSAPTCRSRRMATSSGHHGLVSWPAAAGVTGRRSASGTPKTAPVRLGSMSLNAGHRAGPVTGGWVEAPKELWASWRMFRSWRLWRVACGAGRAALTRVAVARSRWSPRFWGCSGCSLCSPALSSRSRPCRHGPRWRGPLGPGSHGWCGRWLAESRPETWSRWRAMTQRGRRGSPIRGWGHA
jgi:hypothetical protein